MTTRPADPSSRTSVERGSYAEGPPSRPTLPVLPPTEDDDITGEVAPFADGRFADEEPTAPIPAAAVAAAVATMNEDEFRTVHVTFEEILARVGPQHLGGPLPPIRDDLYTTAPDTEQAPVTAAIEALDEEWSDS